MLFFLHILFEPQNWFLTKVRAGLVGTIKGSIPQVFISIESTMKLATILVLSLVILGATASPQRGGGGRRGGGGGGRRGGGGRGGLKKILESCDPPVDRDFCDEGRPDVRPFVDGERDCSSYVGTTLERGERPEREECTVGDRVICFRFKIKVRFHSYFFNSR